MYQCSSIHESAGQPKIGILLSNLGTPDAPTSKAVKPYLRQFLSDTRVIEPPPPKWVWKIILNAVILNLRPRKSAKAYQTVWDTHGEQEACEYAAAALQGLSGEELQMRTEGDKHM